MSLYKNLTLEMSSKPFKSNTQEAMEVTCRKMFRQWRNLALHADVVSVMLWTADGSEILEYKGDMDETFEWAQWVGVANSCIYPPLPPEDPENQSVHRNPQLYMENPPEYTYGWLKRLTETLKTVGREVTGKPIKVGATFDPGPEFAKSKFKYENHPEVCMGGTMGKASFVCCYASLNGDNEKYAGFPEGIPDGTTFGKFLGRQAKHFCADIGFDYLWLSNGFGFGLETWAMYGAVFDGEKFSAEMCEDVKAKNVLFWESFREECPDIPLETRGTNLSTGMDLSSDAVPLKDIYEGGYGLQPPPNSPWAAINGDFGMEMIGWMSHIAEIPEDTFPFRFYTHDPWFINSPWLDRYQREPHDIFLPLAMARMDESGEVQKPTSIEMLTVDDSWGEMPEEVPNEVMPYIIDCAKTSPDQAGPLLWVYPFEEYHKMTYGGKNMDEVFFGDWFMRSAFNECFPMNTVISTGNFAKALDKNPAAFSQSILVSPMPHSYNLAAKELLDFAKNGGKVMLYGPVDGATPEMLDALGLSKAEELEGEFELALNMERDIMQGCSTQMKIRHEALSSGGGIAATAKGDDNEVKILATAKQGSEERVIASSSTRKEWNGGQIVWVRGTNSFTLPENKRAHHPEMLAESDYFRAEVLMRYALSETGISIRTTKYKTADAGGMTPGKSGPMMTVSRNDKAFYFAGHAPDTSASLRIKMPQGAPLFTGNDTTLDCGCASYTMPKAWRKMCRTFIEQDSGLVSCNEICSGHPRFICRNLIDGLKDATVRFYPVPGRDDVEFRHNPAPYGNFSGEELKPEKEETEYGVCYKLTGITGKLKISW